MDLEREKKPVLRRHRVDELRRVNILAGLSDTEIEGLVSTAARGTYQRGDLILAQSDEREDIFPIVAGEVRLSRVSASGREVTVGVLRTGDIFGLAFLVAPPSSRSALVAGHTPTVVYQIPQSALRQLLDTNSGVAVRAIELLGRELARMADRVEDLALHDTATRLEHALVEMAQPVDKKLVVRQTHAEIAAWIGVRPEEVTKRIAALRREGVIHTQPRRPGITIVNLERLSPSEEKFSGM